MNCGVSVIDGMEGPVLARGKVRKRRNLVSQEDGQPKGSGAKSHVPDADDLLRREQISFAAKVRGARAVLGWSQRELGARVSLTQKSIYRMEQGTHDLRRSTVVTVEQVLRSAGIEF